jgi:hypothetical protein
VSFLSISQKLDQLILLAWDAYTHKVASGLQDPENEKVMQLQLALILQTLAPVFEHDQKEDIKVILEVPRPSSYGRVQSIDIVLRHNTAASMSSYAIELKCFRLFTRDGKAQRGAQNLGMYDYWEDIERVESYVNSGCYVELVG